MLTTSGIRLSRRLRRRTCAALASLSAVAVVSGLTAAPVASLTPSEDCPLAYPVAGVTKGQSVHGLTVTSGTTPESFTGEILGVYKDGIAPGMDMIMAELTSPEIDRVGIWQGMSGSPVYAADGRLIGAVSYGLTWGSSPVAGITPAEEMYRQLSDKPLDAAPPVAAGAEQVTIPPAMTQRMVSSGAATQEEVSDGMSRLLLPVGISGMVNGTRLKRAAKAFSLPGARVYKSGSAAAAGDEIPVVAGGNLAASLSYGDVSAVGVGTATAVCGDEVLAFGHPMMFSGPSQMTMHGADALYIQADSAGPGFKLANAGAPIGAITQDRLSGLLGLQDKASVPPTAKITSYVEVPGDTAGLGSRTGTTRISVSDSVPDISAFHLLADQDRVFDGVSGGSATVGWTVRGKQADGSWFIFRRTDKFANKYDVSFESIFDLYDQLARIHFNDLEDVQIKDIETTSTMSRKYQAYKVEKVRVLERGHWRLLRTNKPLFLRGGTVKKFRVVLTSQQLGTALVRVNLPVPKKIGFKSGMLEILGGNSDYGMDGYFEEEYYMGYGGGSSQPKTFDGLLASMRSQPRNDQVIARLMLFRRNGSAMKSDGRAMAKAVVNGGVSVEVQGMG